ncbi:MAG: hypothetical protein IPK26_25705 [Planctomycetes bacterium]|nr:hypothetical protein [Planctomycetota bacterium]
MRVWLAVLPLLWTACSAPPLPWRTDLQHELSAAKVERRDLVVYFSLPGRDLSDKMERQSLPTDEVLAALAAGDFRSVKVDGFERKQLYATWIGGGEGMGIAVLDPDANVWAARPGPQDPDELAAYLRLCTARRPALLAARARLEAAPDDARLKYELARLRLELGARVGTEALFVDAAMAGIHDARHRLARLHALDGNLLSARRWLQDSPKTAAAAVTEGYVLFKERRHAEAVVVLGKALDQQLGDERQRALLYYGKALHESGQDAAATQILGNLAAAGTGSTFEAAARHALQHMQSKDHGHSH